MIIKSSVESDYEYCQLTRYISWISFIPSRCARATQDRLKYPKIESIIVVADRYRSQFVE